MEIPIKYAIAIAAILAFLSFSYTHARRAEAKMDKKHFVIKQMLLFPVMSFVLVGMGVFVYLIILFTNLNKGNSLSELSANDSIGMLLGTIFVGIGGFLVYITRWRMIVLGDEIFYTPFLGKTRIIRMTDVKRIRGSLSNPGFSAFDKDGKKLFAVSIYCRGYALLEEVLSPYIDNPEEIPKFQNPVQF